MPIDIILKYFPGLTDLQQQQFAQLDNLYREWNAKINVISRKDIDNLYEHHILHSLAIAKVINFRPTTQILDFGTGGGFPGIPLAILFPECQFRLIDGTGKKIRVAQEVCQAIGLTNCQPVHLRGEDEKGKYDFVVSRAVMPLPDLVKIVRRPSFHKALAPDEATKLFDYFVEKCSEDVPCETGVFGAFMKVSLLNNGPVTILLEKEFDE